MIPRITRGSSARAALAYDFGPGRREEHLNPRTVAGNVPGTWREQAEIIDETVTAKPRVEKGIWRTSLRAAPQDRTLTDAEWGAVAGRYVQAMGVGDCPWTATRHGEDHVHLTVSRVSWEGKVKSLSHDFAKAQAACRAIEAEHHLIDASTRYDRAKPQVVHGEREFAARRAQVPEREQLRDLVGAATTAAAADLEAVGAMAEVDANLRGAYESQLRACGVLFRANVASTGRVSGYSYGLDGHLDAAGEQVFFKGSQLGKAYTWAATSRQLQADVERAVAVMQSRAQPPLQPRAHPTAQTTVEPPQATAPTVRAGEPPQGLTTKQAQQTIEEQAAGMSLAQRMAHARATRQAPPGRQAHDQQEKQPIQSPAPQPEQPLEQPRNRPAARQAPPASSPSRRPLVSAEERQRLLREHEAIRAREAQHHRAVAAAEATHRQASTTLQRAEVDLTAAVRVRDDVAADVRRAGMQVDQAARALAAARDQDQRRSWVTRARQQLAEDLGTLTGGRAGAPRGQIQAHLQTLEERLQGAQQNLRAAQRVLGEQEQVVGQAHGVVQRARAAAQAAKAEVDQAHRSGPRISMTATAYEQLLHREALAADPEAARRWREALDPYSEVNQRRRGRSPGPGPDRGRGHGR